MKNVLLALICLLFFQSAYAGESEGYTAEFNACLKTDGPITGVLGTCSEIISAKAEVEIVDLSNKIQAIFLKNNPKDAEKFKLAQSSWAKYRSNNCELSGQYLGGVEYSYCPYVQNNLRIIELRNLYSTLKNYNFQ